ncbi:Transcriptional regulatory protein algP [Labilithrix luteola]|uniref:Transcriptional regulatory protein algP n=1 Tax=Labilithrix luteola TaxID=1391654 RepID=A0A0K1Q1Z8_9BACT|nr:SRPBCC domain-containing protein [Labilithrix luteola]AKU99399.1 Transcriptional regulatory protein algP [Labilithrix luteola]
MKKEALRVVTTIPVAPTTLFYAWLDSAQHSAMTGGVAKVSNEVGAKFSAWDGYITGKFVALDLGRRILMSWRTTDFPREAPDSRVEVYFEALGGSTRATVLHTDIPEGQGETYRATWNDKYFGPMRAYFSQYLPDPRLPPPVRRPPPPPEDLAEEEEEEEAKEVPAPKKSKPDAKAPPPPPPPPSSSKAAKPKVAAVKTPPPPPAKASKPAPAATPSKPAPAAKPSKPEAKASKPAPKAAKPAAKPAAQKAAKSAPAAKPAKKAAAKKPAKKAKR